MEQLPSNRLRVTHLTRTAGGGNLTSPHATRTPGRKVCVDKRHFSFAMGTSPWLGIHLCSIWTTMSLSEREGFGGPARMGAPATPMKPRVSHKCLLVRQCRANHEVDQTSYLSSTATSTRSGESVEHGTCGGAVSGVSYCGAAGRSEGSVAYLSDLTPVMRRTASHTQVVEFPLARWVAVITAGGDLEQH